MALDGHLAGLILLSDLDHLVHEAGGTANDGGGDGVLRHAADHHGSVRGSSLQLGDQALVLAELLGGQSGGGLVAGGGGGLHGAAGVVGHAGVKADDGDVLAGALLQDLLHRIGGQGGQSQGLGVLGHLALDHVHLGVDLGLGSRAVEVDVHVVILGGGVGAGLNGHPELVLEALRHNGDVHSLAIGAGSGIGRAGGGIAGAGSGVLRAGGLVSAAAAGGQSQDHDHSQKQCKDLLGLLHS